MQTLWVRPYRNTRDHPEKEQTTDSRHFPAGAHYQEVAASPSHTRVPMEKHIHHHNRPTDQPTNNPTITTTATTMTTTTTTYDICHTTHDIHTHNTHTHKRQKTQCTAHNTRILENARAKHGTKTSVADKSECRMERDGERGGRGGGDQNKKNAWGTFKRLNILLRCLQ